MFKKKTKIIIVVIILLIATVIIWQSLQNTTKIQQEKTAVNVNNKQSKMKSLAQPNWWIKPKVTAKAAHKKTRSVSTSSEPVSNFLIMPDMNDWSLQKNKKGIASATYEFINKDSSDENEQSELAIIRMNAQVALSAVLSIWQNKAGLSSTSPTKSTEFITKKKQTLELFTFKGESKTILVAVHKGKKHTFFRLSFEHKANQLFNKEIENKFKNFLSEIYIHN